jgi:peroxiredoxin
MAVVPPAVVPPVPGLDGKPVDLLAGAGTKAVALIFVGVDCPISNRYAPDLQRLEQDYAPRGVAFYLVYPDPAITPDAARRHAAEYGLSFPALLDREHQLVELTGVEVTPEAAVLGADGKVLYVGRIDDRWVDLNQRRPQASRHELRNALEAAIEGRVPPLAAGHPVGCYIEPLDHGAKRPDS